MFKKLKEKFNNRSFIDEIPEFEEKKMCKKKYKEFITIINKYKNLLKKLDNDNENFLLKEKKNAQSIFTLKEKLNNLSEENIALNENLINADYFQDFNLIFEKSMKNIFETLGINLIKKISLKNNEIDNGLKKLINTFSGKNNINLKPNVIEKNMMENLNQKSNEKNLTEIFKHKSHKKNLTENLEEKSNEKSNYLEDNIINKDDKKRNINNINSIINPNNKNINELFDNFKYDIKILNRDIEIIKSNFNILLKDLKNIYYEFSKKNNSKILQKYSLNEIFLISEKKFKKFTNELSIRKRKISDINKENKIINKNLKNSKKKNLELKKELEKLYEDNFKKEKQYDIIFEKNEKQVKEIKGYLEILGTLQVENKNLNEKTKNILDNKELVDKEISDLKKEKNEKIIDLRKLKLENEKNLKEENFREEKIKDLENIIKNENLKNKNLFLENQKLKKKIDENKKQMEKLKKKILLKRELEKEKKNTIKTSTNESLNNKRGKSPFFLDLKNEKKILDERNKKKVSEKEIQLLNQIENLKMILSSTKNQLTIERNIFDDFRSETNLELEKNQDFIFQQKKKN